MKMPLIITILLPVILTACDNVNPEEGRQALHLPLIMKIRNSLPGLVVTVFFILALSPAQGESIELEKLGPVQAIAVHPLDPSSLYLISDKGLYLTTPEKQAELLSLRNNKLISITVAYDKTSTLYVSGHPPIGGNLGLLRSKDYGHNWERVSADPNGPMAFENLAVSYTDPKTIYGVYQGLRVSHDAGSTWLKVGVTPPGLFSIAVSGHDSRLLYAATRGGLYVSRDGGRSWNDP